MDLSGVLCLLAAVLEDPQKYNGKTIPVVGEHISQPEMAQIVSDVTGKNIKYDTLSNGPVKP